MLADKEKFDRVETELRARGLMDQYEHEKGKVRGRMMIMQTTIPEELGVSVPECACPCAFLGTFDFYDCAVGIAIDMNALKPITGVWVTPQVEKADAPYRVWQEFFLKTLFENIDEDGSFGVPICTFVWDEGDLTIVPVAPEEME